jgi:hypothetical protein
MNSVPPICAGVFETAGADRAVAGLLAAVSRRTRSASFLARSSITSSTPAAVFRRATAEGSSSAGSTERFWEAYHRRRCGGDGRTGLPSRRSLSRSCRGGWPGFVGAMMTRGFEPEIADFYDQALTKGQYLVAVEDVAEGPSMDSAEAVFQSAGATPMAMSKG